MTDLAAPSRVALLLAVACSSHEPRARPDSDYKFAFVLLPSGNDVALGVDDTEIEYDFRLHGECLGRRVEGEPFTARKRIGPSPPIPGTIPSLPPTGTVWLAPEPDIAVGMIVRSHGRELARGCGGNELVVEHPKPIPIELR